MVIDVPVFSEKQSLEVARKLENLRSFWLKRGLGFYTFGIATYLDIMCSKKPIDDYYNRISYYNNLISEHFEAELEEVKRIISEYFKISSRFEPKVAFPGFHIFENEGLTLVDLPSQHFDLQHRYLQWPFGPVSDDVISFTLPIKIPKNGAALDFWSFDESDWKRLEKMGRKVDIKKIGQLKPLQRHEYRVGVMTIQLKPILHRIAAISRRFAEDQRITLQGHAVKNNNEWVLYW